jgi:hypothetical protein
LPHPHTANNDAGGDQRGWTAPGAFNSITAVNAGMGWRIPSLNTSSAEVPQPPHCPPLSTTYNKTDKQAEFDTTNASYHGGGRRQNTTRRCRIAQQASLAAHHRLHHPLHDVPRNYRLRQPPTPPLRLRASSPHTSKFRSLLIANYRPRPETRRKATSLTTDLCYLCHSEAPFSTTSQDPSGDTNFRLHGFHLTSIGGDPAASRDINTAGAGPGNAICAECHFENHSTKFAPWAANRNYARGVNRYA